YKGDFLFEEVVIFGNYIRSVTGVVAVLAIVWRDKIVFRYCSSGKGAVEVAHVVRPCSPRRHVVGRAGQAGIGKGWIMSRLISVKRRESASIRWVAVRWHRLVPVLPSAVA